MWPNNALKCHLHCVAKVRKTGKASSFLQGEDAAQLQYLPNKPPMYARLGCFVYYVFIPLFQGAQVRVYNLPHGVGRSGPGGGGIGGTSACLILIMSYPIVLFLGLICLHGSKRTCTTDITGWSSLIVAPGAYPEARGQMSEIPKQDAA